MSALVGVCPLAKGDLEDSKQSKAGFWRAVCRKWVKSEKLIALPGHCKQRASIVGSGVTMLSRTEALGCWVKVDGCATLRSPARSGTSFHRARPITIRLYPESTLIFHMLAASSEGTESKYLT